MTLSTEPGFRLAYIVPHEAHYRNVVTERSVTVMKAADRGGVGWEFEVVEHRGNGIRVEMFDDAFAAFAEIAPLFTALAEDPPGSLDDVRVLLDRLGFTDATQRTDPRTVGRLS